MANQILSSVMRVDNPPLVEGREQHSLPLAQFGSQWVSQSSSTSLLWSVGVSGLPTEYTECWPCPLFDTLLNKYFLLASLVAGRETQCTAGAD
jgi:hypothetical protein